MSVHLLHTVEEPAPDDHFPQFIQYHLSAHCIKRLGLIDEAGEQSTVFLRNILLNAGRQSEYVISRWRLFSKAKLIGGRGCLGWFLL